MIGHTSPQKLWNIGFIFLIFINLINASSFGMTMPITPGYIVSMGATLAYAGLITGIISFVALFTRPVAGFIGDRLNKKWLLAASTFFMGLVMISYALLPGVAWLVPIRIFHGIFFSISGTLSFALGAHYIPENRIGEGVGFLGVGQVIGRAIGPVAGIYLAENYSYAFSFTVSGIVLAAAGLSIIALGYDHSVSAPPASITPAAADKPARASFRFNDLVAMALLPNAFFAGLLVLSNGVTNSYLVMLGAERNISNIGLFFIVNSIVLFVSRPVLGKLADNKGAVYTIVPGFILTAAAMAVVALSHTLWLVLISSFLLALGGGALPAIQADCLKMLPRERKSLAMGTYFIGLDIGMGIGQIFGGISIAYLGFTLTFSTVGAITLAGLGFYLLYWRRRNERQNRLPS